VRAQTPTWAGLLYLAMVLDVYSRRIVGWAGRVSFDIGRYLVGFHFRDSALIESPYGLTAKLA
jgi:hypothetical protein